MDKENDLLLFDFDERSRQTGFYFQGSLIDACIPRDVLNAVPVDLIRQYKVIPYQFVNDTLVLITNLRETIMASAFISKSIDYPVEIKMADDPYIVTDALKHYYSIDLQDDFSYVASKSSSDLNTPLKRLVESILADSIALGASDIHLLPGYSGMIVQFRINGHLVDYSDKYVIPIADIPSVINIIKNKDQSNQASTSVVNMPNAGSWTLTVGDSVIFCRLSTIPISVVTGDKWQKVNVRNLPQKKDILKLSSLGYLPEDLNEIRASLLRNGSGMFVLSGQTGSGKTTSLYAMIDDVLQIANEPKVVCTIENPVEIHDKRFVQTQVRESDDPTLSLPAYKIAETFLRQDPDILLYGEIRSKEDAEVAVVAAETGLRLFTTVHARNCVSTIVRLLNLGVNRVSLLSELNLIISQKLVAVLCPHCRKVHELTDLEKSILDPDEIDKLSKAVIYEPGNPDVRRKCVHCNNGFVSKTVVSEYVILDDEMRDIFMKEDVSFSSISNVLKKKNFIPMWDKVFDLVLQGKVSLFEAIFKVGKVSSMNDKAGDHVV